MDLVRVKIKGIVVTPQYGTLSPGDELRTDPTFARHLVEDCNAAEYLDAQPAEIDQAHGVTQKPRAKAKKGGAA